MSRSNLRVTKRIYGPGPTRRSRVLLAVPGRDYPADFVLTVTGGDSSLIADAAPAVAVVDDHEISTLDRHAPKVVAADEDASDVLQQVAGVLSTNADLAKQLGVEEGDEDESSPVVDLAKLDRDALLDLAEQRGVDVPARATKVQIIGALQAAEPTED